MHPVQDYYEQPESTRTYAIARGELHTRAETQH